MFDWLWARLDGARHVLRRHQVDWRTADDDLCPGDIVCHTCNTVVWCRAHDPWRRQG